MNAGSSTFWLLACMLAYALLAGAGGVDWEPQHDEAWTHIISTGRLETDVVAHPVPIHTVYEKLEGDPDWSMADVMQASRARGLFNPPAYYLLLHWWTGLFGAGQLAVRVPAYLVGLLSLLGTYFLARRLFHGTAVARAATLLLSLSPWFHGISNFARPYFLVVCIGVWSTYLVMRLVEERRLVWIVAFALVSLLGICSVYHYVFVLAWHAVVLVVVCCRAGPHGRWHDLPVLAGGFGLIGIGFAPWIPSLMAQLAQLDQSYIAGSVPLSDWPLRLLRLLGKILLMEFWDGPRFRVAEIALQSLGVLTLVLLCLPPRPKAGAARGRGARAVLWSFILVPVMIGLADILNGTYALFVAKTWPLLIVVLMLLIARACVAASTRVVGLAALCIWCFLFIAEFATNQWTASRRMGQYERVAEHVRLLDERSHLVIVPQRRYGVLYPLYQTLRNEGIHRVHTVSAPGSNIIPMLDFVARQDTYRLVTVIYPDHQQAEPWNEQDRKLIGMAVSRARQAGWKVSHTTRAGRWNVPDPDSKHIVFLRSSAAR